VLTYRVGTLTTTYAYDGAGQLTSESRTGYSATYSYDANGNRLTRTVGGTTENYTYDDGDKLEDVKVGGTAIKTFGYDAAGRTTSVTTSAGTTTIGYDFESRATSISGPGISQSNTYNGLDTRVSSTTNSVSNTFLRDGAYVTDPVVKDSNATYTPGLYERRAGSTRQLHHNLKNVELQTTLTPAVSASRTYDAFGNILGGTGTHLGPFGYGGGFGYQEDATGLQLLGHRLYDSSTGRFLTRDPIKDGRNWYVYCDSDPIGSADPDGLAYWIFNGSQLILISDNGKDQSVVSIIPAYSGLPGTNPTNIGEPFVGPLPPGDYYVSPDQIGNRTGLGLGYDFRGGEVPWGNARVPLMPKPGTDTLGRDGFFIHGGRDIGSAGCIDVGFNDLAVMGLIEKWGKGKPMTVKVDYGSTIWPWQTVPGSRDAPISWRGGSVRR
jgi:RHS repeat-associated protein